MTGAGFPPWRRIRKRREFRAAQRSGRRVSCRHFVLLVALGPTERPEAPDAEAAEAARLGLIAARKVGPAVARNRAKRLVREWFRQRAAKLPAGIDLIVVLRPGTGSLPAEEAMRQLDAAIPQIARRADQLQRTRR